MLRYQANLGHRLGEYSSFGLCDPMPEKQRDSKSNRRASRWDRYHHSHKL
jgi:hypothetical protein